MYFEEMEDAVNEFLSARTEPFSLEDICKTAKIEGDKDREMVGLLLTNSKEIVKEQDRYHPKKSFLKGLPIRINPTDFEINNGILVPGHRVIPFQPFGELMDEVSFRYKSNILETKVMSFKMHEIEIYFSLMDFDDIPILNVEDILEDGADLDIDVHDFRKFYDDHDFKQGDSVIFRLSQDLEGVFDIEYDSKEDFTQDAFLVKQSDKAFIEAFTRVLDGFIGFPSAEKQLLCTYFYLDKDKWTVPGTGLEDLLNDNHQVTSSALHDGTKVLHYADQDLNDLGLEPDFSRILEEGMDVEPDLDTLNGILQLLGNSNDETLVRAFLLDQIAEGKSYDYQTIAGYLFKGLEAYRMPAEIQDKFNELLEKEFDSLFNSFDPKRFFLPIISARKQILKVALQIAEFLRLLDESEVEPNELPQKEMLQIMEFDGIMNETLFNLEQIQLEGEVDLKSIRSIQKMMEKMEKELPRRLDSILRSVGIKQ